MKQPYQKIATKQKHSLKFLKFKLVKVFNRLRWNIFSKKIAKVQIYSFKFQKIYNGKSCNWVVSVDMMLYETARLLFLVLSYFFIHWWVNNIFGWPIMLLWNMMSEMYTVIKTLHSYIQFVCLLSIVYPISVPLCL